MRPSSPWCLAVLCALVACGEATEEELNGVEALSEASQSLNGACDDTRLAWASAGDPSNICAVPWQYGLDCNKSGTNVTCGPSTGFETMTCYDYPTCRLPQFGVQGRATTNFSQTVTSCTAYTEQECRPKPHTPDVELCTDVTRFNCATQCLAAANAKRNSLPLADRNLVVIQSVQGATEREVNSGSCTFTLTLWPTYIAKADPACGASTGNHSCPDPSKPIYPTCRHNNFGNDVATACNANPLFHPADTSLNSVKLAAAAKWAAMTPKNYEPSPLYVQQPLCRTCDHLTLTAASTAVQVTAKYDCLVQQGLASGLPAGAGGAQLRTEVVSRLKLLFELHGHQLTPAQVQFIRGLYLSDPSANTNCSAGFIPPSTPGCGTSLTALNASMDLCTRLSSSHVPGISARSQAAYCVGLASQVAAVPAGVCQGDVYREKYHAMWLKLYERTLSDIRRDDVPNDTLQRKVPNADDVRTHLKSISDWYAVQQAQMFPGALNSPTLMKQLSETFGMFWKVAYENALLNVNGLPLHAQPLNAGLLVDQAVLKATLTGTPAMSGPPLLMLLGDGFSGLFQRMEDFSYLHDLGCRFKGCAAGTVDTETGELWALFGAVPEATTLQAAISAANKLNTAGEDHAGWVSVFGLLHSNHVTFTQAVLSATGETTYSPALLKSGAAGAPPPLARWAQLVEKADAYSSSYAKSGFFVSTTRDTLKTGTEEYKANFINDVVATRKSALTTALNEFTQHRAALINEVLGEVANAANQKTVRTTLARKLNEFYSLNADLVGLQDNLEIQRMQFSDFAAAFNTTLENESPNLGTDIQRGPVQVLSIGADEARWSPGGTFNILSLAVRQPGPGGVGGPQAFGIPALRGELLNFEVSGEYTPSCAISGAMLPHPSSGTPSAINLGNGQALTGPGGYTVTYSGSGYEAESANLSMFSKSSVETRLCAGVKTEAGAEFFGNGTTAYVSAEACVNNSTGIEGTFDQQSGSEQRSTASFSMGLRLPNTPFPNAPVGSLLLVAMTPGGTGRNHIRDVQVLQSPHTGVVVEADTDYFLVVNDVGSCADDLSHRLTVKSVRLMPTGEAARALGKAMATVMTELRGATPAYVEQGRVTSSELEALRVTAESRLLQQYSVECPGCQMSGMPDIFSALFVSFATQELARLERLVQLRTVERAIELQLLDIQSLADDLTMGANQARLLRLLPLWRLRNLDGEELRDKSRALTGLVTEYLYPTLDLRHPSSLVGLKTNADINALLQANWSDDFTVLADKALAAVTAVEGALAQARITDKLPKDVALAFAFPNPAFNMPTQWHAANPERSETLWNTLLLGTGEVSITLTPDDLYSVGGQGGALLCQHHMPIIKNLGVQVVRPFSSTNASDSQAGLTVPVRWGDVLAYPSTAGIKNYVMLNQDFLVGAPHLLFGNDIEVLTLFAQDLQQPFATIAGNGLSPFGTFNIRLGNVPPALFAEASALVITMKVDVLELATPVSGVTVCQ
ncbi:hypothetical protein FJV41_12770 [Myxococcus llanfairpwllgwyngyllgogerychwyrndrobwllllantysiliogogogochensis]|uniref:Lipoprotein n=1 Tax=Myxococcus llanfairpwllgwyngyllgogerychwyrndrobwllllantysiliogogogochensis TaxID=2590453 RepID=A0A540X2X0_9BACT|nr:hypothetical protein [Myxococcus llanfairpwllgwyngyllgogerychwyrndrobwllllantysiliogogogochensis]TQF15580.1 hypothetical protein FJV41_12770 [Myxococcus llanfairpwllgwyngyllgogerychwyrndrobwllllantysiliogogogochensis]